MMRTTDEFVDDFMNKLENNEFKKDILPEIEPVEPMTMEYVKKQLEGFDDLLNSNIGKTIMDS